VGKDRCENTSHFFYLLFSHANLPLNIFSSGVIATRDLARIFHELPAATLKLGTRLRD
jgi:hypothetical protein